MNIDYMATPCGDCRHGRSWHAGTLGGICDANACRCTGFTLSATPSPPLDALWIVQSDGTVHEWSLAGTTAAGTWIYSRRERGRDVCATWAELYAMSSTGPSSVSPSGECPVGGSCSYECPSGECARELRAGPDTRERAAAEVAAAYARGYATGYADGRKR